jgi:hypothetical protein
MFKVSNFITVSCLILAAIITTIFAPVVILSQDMSELKIIKSPPISLERVNEIINRDSLAISEKISQSQANITNALQDTANLQNDSARINFETLIGGKSLVAANKYEADILKAMASKHKILTMQRTRGLITEDQYQTACNDMIHTFRSAMSQRSMFDSHS